MAEDDKKTPKPGLKKAALPRPEGRPDAIRPSPRLTPIATKAVNPDEHAGSREAVYSDLPVDAPSEPPSDEGFSSAAFTPSTAPAMSKLFTEEQMHGVAEQLKGIVFNAVKASIPPTAPTPSMPVRAAKATGKYSGHISLGIVVLGLAVEFAARKFLHANGPWTEFFVVLGETLQRM